MSRPLPIYGLLAEFETATDLLNAAAAAHQAGYRRVDAYSPFPVEGLAEALGFRRTGLPHLVFVAGLIGCVGGFFMQYYAMAISYPLNIAGRPLNSWPAFLPVTFELTVLIAGLAAILGMLALNGLPRPHHPVFNVPRFALSSRDRFFLLIKARDPRFDRRATRDFLQTLRPYEVSEVAD